MITTADFNRMRALLGDEAEADIAWAEAIQSPKDADSFALEVVFVICNSGMKNTVARTIFERCVCALRTAQPIFDVFKHPGKSAAIETVWRDRVQLLAEYRAVHGVANKLAFLQALPWIGEITKYHIAKNFGADVAKPDVHLQRLADREACTVQALCERIAREVGLRVASVDTVLWRACANGVINSRSGEFAS